MMSKKLWKPLLAVPSLLSATIAVSAIASVANAAEPVTAAASPVAATAASTPVQPVLPVAAPAPVAVAAPASINVYASEGITTTGIAGQVTSVSQLSDVKPTDWAFQALQSLVERYGCIVGYPDKTYRGNRALTRYEFAAGLNACMDRINELIAAGTADLVKKEDLLAVQRLQEEFAAELATLRGRVDALEARTATLEKQQFSTTTKLNGEVIFAIADTFGDRATRNGRNGFGGNGVTNAATENALRRDQTQTIFADRVRLNLDSSFSGKDRLHTRLQAANFGSFNGAFTGTNETRLGYDEGGGNSIGIDELNYRFPLGDNLRVQVDAVKNEFYDGYVSSLSPFTSSGLGSNSRFGRFNSTLRSGAAGAGFTFDYKFGPALSLQGGYISDSDSNDPAQKNGLFNGAYSAIGQVVIRPAKALEVALSYVRSYYPGGSALVAGSAPNVTASTGSAYASAPFLNNPTSVDTFGAQVNLRLSPNFILGGWFGYYKAYQGRSANEAEIYTGSVYLAFPDLGKKGNLGGIIVGVPAKVTGNSFSNAAGVRRFDDDTTFHVEALYRYRLTDNIAITPGLIVIFNPEGNNNNDTQYVGVIRTTFTF